MHLRPPSRSWFVAGLLFILVSVGGVLGTGLHYWHESDYWLVGIPGFGTAIGTIALAGATFRLIQREGAERENTLVALRHSQTIAEQSQTAALEAARHRRDDRARLLRITAWQGIQTYLDAVKDSQLIRDDHYFDLPKDGNQKLLVAQVFEVLPADGGHGCIVQWLHHQRREAHRYDDDAGAPWSTTPRSLAWFIVERTIADWVEIYRQRAAGQPGDEGHAWIGVDDTFDDGVIDSYEIMQGGCPLRKSPDVEGRWILDARGKTEWNFPQVVFAKRPMKRSYYISKIDNQPLGGER